MFMNKLNNSQIFAKELILNKSHFLCNLFESFQRTCLDYYYVIEL